jgi:hypothetical protein
LPAWRYAHLDTFLMFKGEAGPRQLNA